MQDAPEINASDAGFRSHLAVFVVTGLFLFTLNLLTSPGSWWFYWPLFFWGWAVAIHAAVTYGTDAPAQILATLRTLIPTSRRATSGVRAMPESAIDAVDERLRHLWQVAREIPDDRVREQAFRICAAADRVARVMTADETDAEIVSWYDKNLLAPTEALLSRYVRLATRGVAGADETLRQVESQNLPSIESRLDALYDQLHRGDVVDLAVASEMLDFELPQAPPSILQSRT
jgi:hypothetical protein